MNQKSGQEPSFYNGKGTRPGNSGYPDAGNEWNRYINEKLKLLSEFSCNWKYEDHEEKQHIEKSK